MAFDNVLLIGTGKNAKPKQFNLGNKSGQIAAKITKEAGDDASKLSVTMTMYDLIEVQPSEKEVTQAEAGGYDANPRLYLICRYDGKQGIRVKCNDADFLQAVLESKKDEIEVTVEASNFIPDGSTRPRYFFTLESWS